MATDEQLPFVQPVTFGPYDGGSSGVSFLAPAQSGGLPPSAEKNTQPPSFLVEQPVDWRANPAPQHPGGAVPPAPEASPLQWSIEELKKSGYVLGFVSGSPVEASDVCVVVYTQPGLEAGRMEIIRRGIVSLVEQSRPKPKTPLRFGARIVGLGSGM